MRKLCTLSIMLLFATLMFGQPTQPGGIRVGVNEGSNFTAENLLMTISNGKTTPTAYFSKDGRASFGYTQPAFKTNDENFTLLVKGKVKFEGLSVLNAPYNSKVALVSANNEIQVTDLTLDDIIKKIKSDLGGGVAVGSSIKRIATIMDQENTAPRLANFLNAFDFQAKFPGVYITKSFNHGVNGTTLTDQMIQDMELIICTHNGQQMTKETFEALKTRIAAGKPTIMISEHDTGSNNAYVRELMGVTNGSFTYQTQTTGIGAKGTHPIVTGEGLFGSALAAKLFASDLMYWRNASPVLTTTLATSYNATVPIRYAAGISANGKLIGLADECYIAGGCLTYTDIGTDKSRIFYANVLGWLLK